MHVLINIMVKQNYKNKRTYLMSITSLVLVVISFFIFFQPVSAQVAFCDLFPCNEGLNDVTAGNTLSLGVRLALYAVGLIFSLFIAAGVFFIIKAALKIIRSEGDAAQIEGSVKIIKGVYAGVIILIVGVLGLVVILAFLQSGRIASTDIPEPDGLVLPGITP